MERLKLFVYADFFQVNMLSTVLYTNK